MEMLVWIGAVLSFAGLIGIVYCIIRTMRDRRAKLSDDALRARLQKAVVINMIAFFASAIGLMMVIVGIFLS